MFAHRVGTIGAIVAVLILSLELLGAVAWKHRALPAESHPRAVQQLDSTLERVTVDR